MAIQALPPTISVPEAGRLLGLGRNAAYRAAARDELPVLRIGGKLRVPTQPLVEMLTGTTRPASQPADKLAVAGTAR